MTEWIDRFPKTMLLIRRVSSAKLWWVLTDAGFAGIGEQWRALEDTGYSCWALPGSGHR